jgi:hypothetical protein
MRVDHGDATPGENVEHGEIVLLVALRRGASGRDAIERETPHRHGVGWRDFL